MVIQKPYKNHIWLKCRRLNELANITITLKNETGPTKSEAEDVVNLLFDEMTNTLAKGDRVEIRRLCSFYAKQHKAYAGKNPKTGVPVRIKPKKLPVFKCGKGLKERVDN